MDRLDSCVEVASLLTDYNKVVEDDTCLERIVTGICEVLGHYSRHGQSDQDGSLSEITATFQRLWDKVLTNKKAYCPSSINFLLKFNATVLLHEQSQENRATASAFITKFPDVFREENSISSSTASSWIASMQILITNFDIFEEISQFINIKLIANLCDLPSIFVRKQACDFLAKLAICLQKNSDQNLSQDLLKNFANVMCNTLPLEFAIKIATKMLSIDYNVAVLVLSDISLCKLCKSQNIEFIRFCKSGEVFLCHFFEAFYDEEMKLHMPTVLQSILPDKVAFEYATTALLANPTKYSGWKMLSSFALHGHDSQAAYSALDFISYPLRFDGSGVRCQSNESLYQKWTEIVELLRSNRTKMTAVICHSLNSISKLWKSSRFTKLLNDTLLPSVMRVACTLHSNVTSVDAKNAVFVENWKVAESLLNVLLQVHDRFLESIASDVKTFLLGMLKQQSTNHAVNLSYRLALDILHKNKDPVFLDEFLVDATQNLLDRNWEVRDSALECLAKLLGLFPVDKNWCAEITPLFKKNSIHNEALRLLKDSDCFVRADALVLIQHSVKYTSLLDEESLITTLRSVINILLNDSEAPPRRSAVFTLLECMKNLPESIHDLFSHLKHPQAGESLNSSPAEDEVHQIILQSIHHALYEDLYWEVKYNAIDILDYLICANRDVHKYRNVEEHFKSMLSKMFSDCEPGVRHKAHLTHSTLFESNSARDCESSTIKSEVLNEIDDLLEEVLVSLRKDEQVRLTHGCHGPSLSADNDKEYDDSVVLDCY